MIAVTAKYRTKHHSTTMYPCPLKVLDCCISSVAFGRISENPHNSKLCDGSRRMPAPPHITFLGPAPRGVETRKRTCSAGRHGEMPSPPKSPRLSDGRGGSLFIGKGAERLQATVMQRQRNVHMASIQGPSRTPSLNRGTLDGAGGGRALV